ncbi:hypothetical protein [Dendronalium sp. ChiSLP03b]|nr:hypothetical protein [Dendronalium sp. ChiSLP03b]MDZ8208363.1 hypothetical protein [Dendronalium sp. ChiSLP03b]
MIQSLAFSATPSKSKANIARLTRSLTAVLSIPSSNFAFVGFLLGLC